MLRLLLESRSLLMRCNFELSLQQITRVRMGLLVLLIKKILTVKYWILKSHLERVIYEQIA